MQEGDGRIRVAVVGVGNCCSALVQGVHYYNSRPASDGGVSYPLIGGYTPSVIDYNNSRCSASAQRRCP